MQHVLLEWLSLVLPFQVAILETGKQIMIAIGIVNEGYDTSKMPGWENGTVGYQTDGNIYDAENKVHGRPTKGQSLEIHCGKRFSKRTEKIQSMPFRNQVAYCQKIYQTTQQNKRDWINYLLGVLKCNQTKVSRVW